MLILFVDISNEVVSPMRIIVSLVYCCRNVYNVKYTDFCSLQLIDWGASIFVQKRKDVCCRVM